MYPWGIQRLVSTYSNRHWARGGWGVRCSESQNSKCQDLPKFQFSGGGDVLKVKTQSAKICLNFNSRGREGVEGEKNILRMWRLNKTVSAGDTGIIFTHQSPAQTLSLP